MNNIPRTTLSEIRCCWQCGRVLAYDEELKDIRLVLRLLRLCSCEALWLGLVCWNRKEELLLLYHVLQWTSILCNVYNGLQLRRRPSEKSLCSLTWWHVISRGRQMSLPNWSSSLKPGVYLSMDGLILHTVKRGCNMWCLHNFFEKYFFM